MPSRRDNEALEQYLLRLESYLSKLPANERALALAEVRQHLEQLVQDEQFGGDKGAIRTALERFGSAKRLARMFYWERVRQEWHRRLNSLFWPLLTGIYCVVPYIVGNTFHLSGPLSVSIAGICGVGLGILAGWKWAQGRRRLWAEDAATGLPKKQVTFLSESFWILLIAFLVALIIELRLPDGNREKWNLAMWTTLLLVQIAIAPLTQRILMHRDISARGQGE